MHGQAIEIPRAVGELLHTGELARPVAREGVGVGEVLVRAGEVQPQRLPGGTPAPPSLRNPSTSEKPRRAPRPGWRRGPASAGTLCQPSSRCPPTRPRLRSRHARGGVRHGRPRVPRFLDRAPRAGAPGAVVGPGRGQRPAGSAGATSTSSPTTPGPRRRSSAWGPSPSSSATRRPGGSSRRDRTARWPSGPGSSSTPASRACPGGSTRPAPIAPAGWTSSCLNLDSRIISSGRTLGYTQDLGRRVGRHRAGPRLHAPCPAGRHRGPGRQPLRAGLHRLPRPAARHAGRRRTRPDRGGRHHRPGVPGRAPWALPRLPGHRAGPPSAPGRGGHGPAGRTTSC